MATSATKQQNLTNRDTLFVGRLVYDVMVYTLSKCGLPETALPTPDCAENVYKRANLVKIAGASALRAALLMRDKWRPMFISRQRSSGFKDKEVGYLVAQLNRVCPLILDKNKDKQSAVEVLLASCNEIILFCYHESIDIDPIMLIKSTASYVILMIRSKQNISKEVEELFRPFHDIWKYTRWITNFIREFAIPYGSRDDVSVSFDKHDKIRIQDAKKEATCTDIPSVKELKDHLGFLPHDAFSAIAVEGSRTLPENLALASGSTLPGDRDSPEPPNSPESSKRGTVRRKK